MVVDVAADEAAVLTWARRARYQIVVCGGAPNHDRLALQLLRAAPHTRVVYLSRDEAPRGFEQIGIHTLPLPLDVNHFVEIAAQD